MTQLVTFVMFLVALSFAESNSTWNSSMPKGF